LPLLFGSTTTLESNFLSLQQACVCYSDQQCTPKTLHFISDCHKLDLENLGENSKQVDDDGVNISKIVFSHASGGVHCCHCGQKDKRCSVIWRKMCIVAGLFSWTFLGLGFQFVIGKHCWGASFWCQPIIGHKLHLNLKP
jgi:hypothetical protein